MAEKKCNNCGNDNDSFAMELLKGYKKQFYVTVAVLSTIILLLTGYIIYYVQDGQGYNNINTGTQGDVLNGTKDEN